MRFRTFTLAVLCMHTASAAPNPKELDEPWWLETGGAVNSDCPKEQGHLPEPVTQNTTVAQLIENQSYRGDSIAVVYGKQAAQARKSNEPKEKVIALYDTAIAKAATINTKAWAINNKADYLASERDHVGLSAALDALNGLPLDDLRIRESVEQMQATRDELVRERLGYRRYVNAIVAVLSFAIVVIGVYLVRRWRHRLNSRAWLLQLQSIALAETHHERALRESTFRVTARIDRDTLRLDRLLQASSDYSRVLADAAREPLVLLSTDMVLLKRYCDLMQLCFPDTFKVLWEVESVRERPVVLPVGLLQPLIANAIEHGFSGHDGHHHITIMAKAGAGVLHLCVRNTGAPYKGNHIATKGQSVGGRRLGSKLMTARLEALRKLLPGRNIEDVRYEALENGTLATLTIPLISLEEAAELLAMSGLKAA